MKKLIFVYNANSDLFSSLKDVVHKMVSPNTYQCNLCKITYGPLSMKEKWKKFVETLKIETDFLHKDEFFEIYPENKEKLPAIFLKEKGLKRLASKKEIDSCKNEEELIKLIKSKI